MPSKLQGLHLRFTLSISRFLPPGVQNSQNRSERWQTFANDLERASTPYWITPECVANVTVRGAYRTLPIPEQVVTMYLIRGECAATHDTHQQQVYLHLLYP